MSLSGLGPQLPEAQDAQDANRREHQCRQLRRLCHVLVSEYYHMLQEQRREGPGAVSGLRHPLPLVLRVPCRSCLSSASAVPVTRILRHKEGREVAHNTADNLEVGTPFKIPSCRQRK